MTRTGEILIYGAGGAGREFASNLADNIFFKIKGFIDDTPALKDKIINEIPVLGGIEYLQQQTKRPEVAVCLAGDPKAKRKLIKKIKATCNVVFPQITAPNNCVTEFISWGEGSIVALPFNHITVDLVIGDFVWINSGNLIGHDARIGDYTTIYSGINIGGAASIGSDCVIGTGAIIKPKITIGDAVIVGAGAVVVKDVPNGVVVVGNPARILKDNQ